MNGRAAIAIVDYGMGNRRSVQKAFEHVGAAAALTADHDVIAAADGLVIPGVGAFPQGIDNLRRLGLDDAVRAAVHQGRPVLGICLGMQLLFDRSEELGGATGLGLIPGEVTRLAPGDLRVPHIGWNEVHFERPCALTARLPPEGRPFYHVHSFAARPDDPTDVAGTATYGERFATIVAREAVYGVQFHPEKSSADGLELLRAFASLCGAGAEDEATSAAMRA